MKDVIRKILKESDWDWVGDVSIEESVLNVLQRNWIEVADNWHYHTVWLIPSNLKNVVVVHINLDDMDEDFFIDFPEVVNDHKKLVDVLDNLAMIEIEVFEDLTKSSTYLGNDLEYGGVEVNSVEDFINLGSHRNPFNGNTVNWVSNLKEGRLSNEFKRLGFDHIIYNEIGY